MPTARFWRKWLRLGEWWLRRVIRPFTEGREDQNRRSSYVVQSRTIAQQHWAGWEGTSGPLVAVRQMPMRKDADHYLLRPLIPW